MTGGRKISFRRFGATQDGSIAVEFALIFPVALIFFMGLLAYGIYFGAAHSVQQLAADAARASVGGLDDAERASIARAHVSASGGAYPLLNLDRISVFAASLGADPSQFEVRVAFDSADLPIWVLSGLVPLPSKTIERAAVVKRGGY
ncbi:pilus biosynthesis protein TadE [Hyphomicrobium nitrativorans NL23]|uniref:Pilus biosynthesis protein TadE n=1 Tax=Hyphomicrobium nitrativorans NL23 TaxID=1029756 RepID=V5SD87_9HYPH|nr:TadE/TadG family type IV pilus assembly protein [Hyphomicrobium nitrativorans]AHB48025.1 pilus biosynthesis protein TadE [Hyphomicrobium nitrativorans NL23]